ncbi:UNVERIFIED_CONTAM: hypothetical protein FKN15_035036 [Acipenser sinensis]
MLTVAMLTVAMLTVAMLTVAMLTVVRGTPTEAMLAATLAPPDVQLETTPPSWALVKASLLVFGNGYPSLSSVLGQAAFPLLLGGGSRPRSVPTPRRRGTNLKSRDQ